MVKLPPIGHFMEGFLQLPTLRCCVPEILVIFTILVLAPKIGQSFDGLGSSEHWASLNFHKDVAGVDVEMPSPLLISLWGFIWLSILIFP